MQWSADQLTYITLVLPLQPWYNLINLAALCVGEVRLYGSLSVCVSACLYVCLFKKFFPFFLNMVITTAIKFYMQLVTVASYHNNKEIY